MTSTRDDLYHRDVWLKYPEMKICAGWVEGRPGAIVCVCVVLRAPVVPVCMFNLGFLQCRLYERSIKMLKMLPY